MTSEQEKPLPQFLLDAQKVLSPECLSALKDLVLTFPDAESKVKNVVEAFVQQINYNPKVDPAGPDTSQAKESVPNRGSGWCLIPKQSFQTPRGNFDVELQLDSSIILHGKKDSYSLLRNNIKSAVELKTADLYNPNKEKIQILFILKEPLQVGKQRRNTVLFTPSFTPKSKELIAEFLKPPPSGDKGKIRKKS